MRKRIVNWKIRLYKKVIKILIFLAGEKFGNVEDYMLRKVGGDEITSSGETIVYILKKEK